MSRLFVCGDIHGGLDIHKLKECSFPEQMALSKEDVLIQLGDFGLVWEQFGENISQEYWLDWVASQNYTTVVVPGNHENYDILETLPYTTKWGNDVQYLERETGTIYFLKRGGVYEINGKKILAIGGAKSIDRHCRIEGLSWWSQETLSESKMEYTMEQIDKYDRKFDYVFSHTCPQSVVTDFLPHGSYAKFYDPVSEFLDEIENLIEYREWHFGHFHNDLEKEIDGCVFKCHYNYPPYELKG